MECFAAFGLMALVAFMAPKKDSRLAQRPGKRGRAEEVEAQVGGELDKTNMLNQLKAAKRRLSSKTSLNEQEDQDKSDLLDSYCKLSLRDPKKNEILKKWLGDKSCSWWASYAEETSTGITTTSETYNGWGTKCLDSIKSKYLSFSFFFYI